MLGPGYDGFLWFIGVITDINDPKKLGRVKVRLVTEQTPDLGQAETADIQNNDLPWAIVGMPVTSASFLGLGQSPTGIQVGSKVVGFFLDGQEKTKPLVMFTFNTIDNGDINRHSVSVQARGDGAVQKDYIEDEPISQYKAQYPFNNTINTRSGHVIEIDDTPSSERIHIYHKAGTYIEINPDGSIVTKSTSNSNEIVVGKKSSFSKKDTNIAAGSTIRIVSDKDVKIDAPGGVTVTNGSLTVEGAISCGAGATGTFTSPTGKTIHVQNGIITNIY